jgi:hypothetical protein
MSPELQNILLAPERGNLLSVAMLASIICTASNQIVMPSFETRSLTKKQISMVSSKWAYGGSTPSDISQLTENKEAREFLIALSEGSRRCIADSFTSTKRLRTATNICFVLQ